MAATAESAEIHRLRVENERLRIEKQAIERETDALRREIDSMEEELGDLSEEALRGKREDDAQVRELQEARRWRNSAVAHGEELDRRLDAVAVESAALLLSAFPAQADLEERLHRKTWALRVVTETVMGMLQKIGKTIDHNDSGSKGGGNNEGMDGCKAEDEEIEMMIKPFVAEVKKIMEPGLEVMANRRGPAFPWDSNLSSEGSASRPLPLSPKSGASPMRDQWQKGELIGKGSLGHVYVATNRETGALCAIKEIRVLPDEPKSAGWMLQLEQEIKVLSQLKHPHIVQYYGSEIVEDQLYIYLEYYPSSIFRYAREHCGAMTESVVRNFTLHILNGLAYLHGKKTVHGDIRCANLLVDALGVVKLADFGVAHLSSPLKVRPYWTAPEVIQSMKNKEFGYDLAVDIWSLGCTIVEMIIGEPPWSEFDGAAAMFKVLRTESPPIPEMLSPEGKNFLRCCFRRNPADRPSACLLLDHPFVKHSNTNEIKTEPAGYGMESPKSS